MEGERRRHARSSPQVQAALELNGSTLRSTRVLDLSPGGALVEVGAGVALPPLGAKGQVRLWRGERTIVRGARVVRVRFTGRERGVPLPPAVALVFDDGDAVATAMAALLATL